MSVGSRINKFAKKMGKINVKYKNFDIKIKGKNKLNKIKNLLTKNKALSNAAHVIFRHKKFIAKVGVAATIVGVGAHLIYNFIESNSGCFKQKGETFCKIEVLSCCQKMPVENLPSCANIPDNLANACKDYDDEKESECCKLCSCALVGCGPGEDVFCRRPGIADALTYFGNQTQNAILNAIKSVVPDYVWEVLMVLLVVWIVGFVYKRFR